jgi:hypothetical protein
LAAKRGMMRSVNKAADRSAAHDARKQDRCVLKGAHSVNTSVSPAFGPRAEAGRIRPQRRA